MAESSVLDAGKEKFRVDFGGCSSRFEIRINEKIKRPGRGERRSFQIAATANLEAIRRMMAEIIISQGWRFPSFADVDRNPFSIGSEFRPAMIAINDAGIFVRRDGKPDRETGWDADGTRERDEVRM